MVIVMGHTTLVFSAGGCRVFRFVCVPGDSYPPAETPHCVFDNCDEPATFRFGGEPECAHHYRYLSYGSNDPT